jgi:hypothetical protein
VPPAVHIPLTAESNIAADRMTAIKEARCPCFRRDSKFNRKIRVLAAMMPRKRKSAQEVLRREKSESIQVGEVTMGNGVLGVGAGVVELIRTNASFAIQKVS